MAIQARCPVLVGRDDELSTLEDALLAAFRGDGAVTALAGEAGIGKTRLAREVALRARKLGGQIMWGGCTEAQLALPYLPFLEAVGNWLSQADVENTARQLGPAARELANLFPQLSAQPAPPDFSEPAQAKVRLFESLLLLLRIAAANRGLLLVVEDLHWADASTRELLEYMSRRIHGSPVMVLATYRSDELHRKHPLSAIVQGWARSRLVDVVELRHLSSEGVAEVVGAIFAEQVSAEFRDFMHDRTQGNPFVIEETLKEAIDGGDIYRTESGWDRKALEEIRIPRSVSDGVLSRVDRLEHEHAEAIRAAAVLGTSFSFTAFVAMTGLDELAATRALEACIGQQLIEEDRYSRDRFRFRHALTREAVYEEMVVSQRQRLHGRAADVLRGRADVSSTEVGHHLFAAGRTADALPVCIDAAEAASGKGGLLEAIALYERALTHTGDRSERGRILGRLGVLCGEAAYSTRAIGYLQEALPIIEAAGETLEAARCRLWLGRAHWQNRNPDLARAEYGRAATMLEPAGPSEELAVAYVRLAALHAFDFEEEEALVLARRAAEIAAAAGSDFARAFASSVVGLALFGLGEEVEGLALIDEALDEALALGHYGVAATCLWNTIELRLGNGRAEDAVSLIDRRRDLPPHPMAAFSNDVENGVLAMCRGELLDAEQLLRNAMGHFQTFDWPWLGPYTRSQLGRVLVERGKLDEARALLPGREETLERQDIEPSMSVRIRMHLHLGETAAALEEGLAAFDQRSFLTTDGGSVMSASAALIAGGRLTEARQLVEASQVSERQGTYPWLLMARGGLALAEGRPGDAKELFSEAASRFAAANYRLDQLRAELGLAEARAAAGEAEALAPALESIAQRAARTGAALVLSEAQGLASRLGIAIAEPVEEPVAGADVASVDAGERFVTVMFADVRGYTTLTNERAPADMTERMSTFYRWARREIERQGGMVDRFAGDAVMATFNVSEVSVDHAQRALEAGIALQDKAALVDLPVGVGIAVGSAVVGRLTGGENVDVIGETTNLAARLQAHAGARETVLDEAAWRRVRPWVEERGINAEQRLVELKGFEGKTPVWVISR